MKIEETHYEFKIDWRQMAAWYFKQSMNPAISPERRRNCRIQWKLISARLKKKKPLHSTGRICVKPTKGKMKKRKYDTHCGICKKPCSSPKGNCNAKSFVLCGKAKCRLARRNDLQRARRAQVKLNLTGKKSKHDSLVTSSKASRAARQNWKSGATHTPI